MSIGVLDLGDGRRSTLEYSDHLMASLLFGHDPPLYDGGLGCRRQNGVSFLSDMVGEEYLGL